MPKWLEPAKRWPTSTLLVAPLIVCGLLVHSLAEAGEAAATAAPVDEAELIQRVKQEVMKELLDGGFLDEQMVRVLEGAVSLAKVSARVERMLE